MNEHQGGTMSDHETYREDLADYAASRLDPARAVEVEGHLKECDDCRGAVSFIRGLGEAIGEAGAALFEPHPDVADLRRYAMGEQIQNTDRIARHLEVCPNCDLELAAWPAVKAMEIAPQPGDSAVPGPLLRRVMGPWLAAAAGLVLGVALSILLMPQAPTERGGAPPPEAWSGPAVHLTIPGAVRGGAPDPTFTLGAHEGPVVLDLQPVIPGAARDEDAFRLTIRSGGHEVWSAAAPAGTMRRALDASGVVTFVVPSRVLAAGRHEVSLAPPETGAAPIFRTQITITR